MLIASDDPGLAARVRGEQRRTGSSEAARVCTGSLEGRRVVLMSLDFQFLGGSMSRSVGERLTRGLELGRTHEAVIAVTQTGGVRVQEGVPAFLQMARIVAARSALAATARPLIAVAADPTMGGVAASLVATADVILAEPGCRLALTGPRAAAAMGDMPRVYVAEEARENGLIDAVVPRAELRTTLGKLIRSLRPPPSP